MGIKRSKTPVAREQIEGQKSQLRQLLDVFDRDRESIALELHDDVLQAMASAIQHIQAACQDSSTSANSKQDLYKSLRLVRQSVRAVRGLMVGLKPPYLDRIGVIETLRCDLRELQDELGWKTNLEHTGGPLPEQMELPLYRILREAITNARKHSRSRSLQVQISVSRQPPEVSAQVQDKGKGFDTALVPPGRMGLTSMKIRAQMLGGYCLVRSSVGRGTTVMVHLPLGDESTGDTWA